MWAYLDSLVRVPRLEAGRGASTRRRRTAPPRHRAAAPPPQDGAVRGASDLPFTQSVFDAGIWIDGSDPDLTKVDIRPGVARDMNILPHAQRGRSRRAGAAAVPDRALEGRHDLQAGLRPPGIRRRYLHASGPLAARVIVNRVWGWHFGKPLVATESDFGVQGEKPTHPELLDDLAARFIANGMSLKWLHREIMLSAAYRQASHPRADGLAADADQYSALAHESAPARH